MPIYEYRCRKGHTFDVLQRMADDPVSSCEVCGLPVQRVFHPVAVHFKGSGFYNTDYGTRKRSREKDAAKENGASSDSTKKESKGTSDNGSSPAKSDSGAGKTKAAAAD